MLPKENKEALKALIKNPIFWIGLCIPPLWGFYVIFFGYVGFLCLLYKISEWSNKS